MQFVPKKIDPKRREGVGKETVRRWVVQGHIDGGQRQGAAGPQSSSRGARPPQSLIVAFIDDLRADGDAVESICRVLREQGYRCQIAARTYCDWARANRRVAAQTIGDAKVVVPRDQIPGSGPMSSVAFLGLDWMGRPTAANHLVFLIANPRRCRRPTGWRSRGEFAPKPD